MTQDQLRGHLALLDIDVPEGVKAIIVVTPEQMWQYRTHVAFVERAMDGMCFCGGWMLVPDHKLGLRYEVIT